MLVHYTLAILSLFVYLYNFFPTNVNKNHNSIPPPDSLHDIKFNVSKLYSPTVDKIVLIIIDAIRLDFVNEEYTPYLVSQVQNLGCFSQVHVQSPTVTLPRIKSLTTGSIPQFIDIALNLASTEVMTNSFLHEIAKKRKKIIFYGDETWLKLYPDIFHRSEGVSSFFVNDFTEVDNNITRYLDDELIRKDWDVMILHYLGLDHIGHVFGPTSDLIPLKLREMDEIFKKLHKGTLDYEENVLFVVTGDHGMKDSGGHGGATFAETNVPFVVSGTKCVNDSIEQTDIASTLSVLMGVNIPSSSVGKLSVNLLNSSNFYRILYSLLYNSDVLLFKSEKYKGILETAKELHYEFLKTGDEKFFRRAVDLYDVFERKTREFLIKSSVKINVLALITSALALFLCFLKVFSTLIRKKDGVLFLDMFIVVFLLIILILFTQNPAIIIFLISIFIVRIVQTLYRVINLITSKEVEQEFLLLLFCCIIHAFSFTSSSFVEEEHQTWYFFGSTFVGLNILKYLHSTKMALKFLVLFVMFRFLRNLNQTGDKWAHLPDLATWFLKEENLVFLHSFFIFGLISTWLCINCINKSSKIISFINLLILFLIYPFKMWYINSTIFGKLLWILIAINAFISVIRKTELFHIWILICALLLQHYNTVLIPFCIMASYTLCKNVKSTEILAIAHAWLGNILFFCQGHSNSLASVNVSSGYVGLSEYNPLLVILQVLLHTYAFPILSHALIIQQRLRETQKICTVLVTLRLLVLVLVCFQTIALREHLFIWSVFTPKLLIESVHSVVLLWEVLVYLFVQSFCT